jgi:hypothetical protein
MVVTQVIGMGGIDKTIQSAGIIYRGERREIHQSRQAFLRVGWEGRIKGSLPVDNTPGFGLSYFATDLLEQSVMGVMGTHRELAQGSNSLADIRAACNIGIHAFTEEATIAETMLGGEIGHFGGTFRGADGAVHGIDSVNRERAGVACNKSRRCCFVCIIAHIKPMHSRCLQGGDGRLAHKQLGRLSAPVLFVSVLRFTLTRKYVSTYLHTAVSAYVFMPVGMSW